MNIKKGMLYLFMVFLNYKIEPLFGPFPMKGYYLNFFDCMLHNGYTEGWTDDFKYRHICGCTDKWIFGIRVKGWRSSLKMLSQKKCH